MTTNMLFYMLLISQVFLLSWYLPKRMQARMRYIFEHYPFENYPKLYGGSLDKTQKNYRRHVVFNNAMVAVGVVLLIAVIYLGDEITGGIGAMAAFIYGMTQAIPLIVMDIAMMRHCKQLREDDDRSERKAELAPRSIFNHTSGSMLAIPFVFFIAAVFFDMYTKDFDLSLGGELFEVVIILGLTNLFFAGLIRWRVYGKKLNPYLDNKDSKKEVDTVVMSSIFTSIAVSIFFIVMRAINVYDLEQLEGAIMSIYLQAIFLFSIVHSMNQFAVEDINFEGFRVNKPN